jgi:hypothetical protein
MGKKKHIKRVVLSLFAFLLIVGLRGTCYTTVLTAQADHACCSGSAQSLDMPDDGCCDDFSPSRIDIPVAPTALMVERIAVEDLTPPLVAQVEWSQTVRPPPREAPPTRQLAPRAPPLS